MGKKVSMREYARQRGVHLNAVQTAVKTGRIHKTDDGKIDVDAANKEWFMNTDPAKSHKTDPLFENPPEAMPVGEIVFKTKSGKYVCSVCGYVYDPAENNGVAFENLPQDWKCPRCRQPKTKFNAA